MKIRKDLLNVPVKTDSVVMDLIVKISMNVRVLPIIVRWNTDVKTHKGHSSAL